MSIKTKYPNLPKNPIEVAIFEIRHKGILADDLLSVFTSFHDQIKVGFPTFKKGYNRNIHVDETPNHKLKARVTTNELSEGRFISHDKKKSLLITNGVFNLNIPGNYSSWEDYYDEFQHLYKKFFSTLKVKCIITGVSVRFINKFQIENFDDPSSYFNTTIYADKDTIEGDVLSFLMQYTVWKKEQNIQINVTQGAENAIDKITPYLFDLDVIYSSIIDIETIPEIFKQLREEKNKAFFSNITEKTLKMLL